jgi:hypothetical protein
MRLEAVCRDFKRCTGCPMFVPLETKNTESMMARRSPSCYPKPRPQSPPHLPMEMRDTELMMARAPRYMHTKPFPVQDERGVYMLMRRSRGRNAPLPMETRDTESVMASEPR